MSLRRALLTVALTATSLLTACALRPSYKDVMATAAVTDASTAQAPVVLRVVDGSGKPVKGARVRAGELRTRVNVVSDADGLVTLEPSAVLMKENPLVEVVLPKGVTTYRLEHVPAGQAAAETPAATEPAPAAPAPAPAAETPAATTGSEPAPAQQPSATPGT
ncbi:hypothetical protein MYSTI_07472 [Myxococcus stipitatus DSM 14675]|uniref:Lipoprotein n=1 Tax=Myxococcus stipitatus (strain DSM 14675 / JCM 12634 / Mx s8) TaxID=1278073 RepID=L7UQA4_MYXSD|nr:hypothetical protein [Myxococcus stipitatus]AGC48744.1 hypothetical protein MYSTI_07472 [Myxococcus stipitatus DSM 14675]